MGASVDPKVELMKPVFAHLSYACKPVRIAVLAVAACLTLILPLALIYPFPAPAQERNQNLESALQRAHAFAGGGGRYSVQLLEKEGFVQVSNYPFNPPAPRIKDAIVAARTLVSYSPTQFTTIAVRFLDPSMGGHYSEVIVTAKDITSLSVGTSSIDDLIRTARVIDVGPQDSKSNILDKYLSIAEKLMAENNYWEAEQVVDASLRAVGTPGDQSRLTQDMLSLADGLDARGDLERAERVLKKVLDVRAQSGKLDDPDANRTIDHLTQLYISDKRYSDAMDMLNKLMSNPNLSQINNPSAFASNLERMGICHFRSKDYDKALSDFTQVVTLKRTQQGDNSPAVAMALEELGDTYKAQGQEGDALSNYKQAHAIYDHAVVSKSRLDKMDWDVYSAHVRQLDQKLGKKQ